MFVGIYTIGNLVITSETLLDAFTNEARTFGFFATSKRVANLQPISDVVIIVRADDRHMMEALPNCMSKAPDTATVAAKSHRFH